MIDTRGVDFVGLIAPYPEQQHSRYFFNRHLYSLFCKKQVYDHNSTFLFKARSSEAFIIGPHLFDLADRALSATVLALLHAMASLDLSLEASHLPHSYTVQNKERLVLGALSRSCATAPHPQKLTIVAGSQQNICLHGGFFTAMVLSGLFVHRQIRGDDVPLSPRT
jgi:hypothetical protein